LTDHFYLPFFVHCRYMSSTPETYDSDMKVTWGRMLSLNWKRHFRVRPWVVT